MKEDKTELGRKDGEDAGSRDGGSIVYKGEGETSFLIKLLSLHLYLHSLYLVTHHSITLSHLIVGVRPGVYVTKVIFLYQEIHALQYAGFSYHSHYTEYYCLSQVEIVTTGFWSFLWRFI